MKLVASLRVSTSAQATDGYGLAVQRVEIEKWAKREGHRIIKWCVDEGISGTLDALQRDGLSCALDSIKPGSAEGLVVARMDRLARRLDVQEAILQMVWQRGGEVFTADTGQVLQDDPDDPMRKALRSFMGLMAELEKGLIGVRMRRGRAAKHEAGGYAYGAPPFGTMAQGGDLVVNPVEAEALAMMRTLRASGMSYRAIVRALDDAGIPTKRGGAWRPATVQQILARSA